MQVTRAIIHVHGASRNADDYFCWIFQSLEIEYGVGGNPGVFIIAPNFLEIVDDPTPLELYWSTSRAAPALTNLTLLLDAFKAVHSFRNVLGGIHK